MTNSGNVSAEALEELVERWRSGDFRKHPGVDTRTLAFCADELEELIEDAQ